MIKETELKRAKRTALLLLIFVSTVFIITLLLPANFWISGIKAIAEAAMVGALADWFAVVALFKRIPIPFVGQHTAIIPRNKIKIADNLGAFVQEKFLDSRSLIVLIRQHDPALLAGQWLSQPKHSKRLARQLLMVIGSFVDLAGDTRIQTVVRSAIFRMLDKLDLSQASAMLLTSLTKNDRHQALLETLIDRLISLIHQPSSRQFIAAQVVRWLKTDHPSIERILPSEWLGERSASLISDAVNSLLDEINHDKNHQIRAAFDSALQRFIVNLQHSPEMLQKLDEVKGYLQHDPAFNQYIGELWRDMHAWFQKDIQRHDSRTALQIGKAVDWFGQALLADSGLRSSLNEHLERGIERMAPDFAQFITQHMSNTVKGWDNAELSRQIELNIGRDLQFIRINGTLVGGAIGLGLYLLSQLPEMVKLMQAG